MPLILQPSLTDQDRQAIEAHRDEIRTRRLSAAIVYQLGVEAKLGHQSEVTQRRIDQTSKMLAKAVDRLDKADEQVTNYLNKLTILLQEQDLLGDLIQSQPEID